MVNTLNRIGSRMSRDSCDEIRWYRGLFNFGVLQYTNIDSVILTMIIIMPLILNMIIM